MIYTVNILTRDGADLELDLCQDHLDAWQEVAPAIITQEAKEETEHYYCTNCADNPPGGLHTVTRDLEPVKANILLEEGRN